MSDRRTPPGAPFEAAAKADGEGRIDDFFAAEPDRLPRLTLETAGLHPRPFQTALVAGRARRRPGPGPRRRRRGPARRHVRRRADQHLRGPRRAAHRPARAARRRHQGAGRAGDRPRSKACARRMADFAERGPRRRDQGQRRQAVPLDPAHRHRRLGPRPAPALGGAEAARSRRSTCASSPMSTAAEFALAPPTSIRPRPWSSSSPRPSPPWRPWPTPRRRATGCAAASARPMSARTWPPSPPPSTRPRRSAFRPSGCSASGTGSAAAIPCGRRSACRLRHRPAAGRASKASWPARAAMDDHFASAPLDKQRAGAAGPGPDLQPQRPGPPVRARWCPMPTACAASPPSCSSWRWSRTARASARTASR